MSEQKESTASNIAEALGCAMFAVCIVAFIVVIFSMQIQGLQNTAERWQEKATKPASYMTGKVANVNYRYPKG